MKRKTYCIYGFIERYVTVRLGKGSVSFHFKDGVMDSSGIQPATYTTVNPIEQSLLENHPDFKNGSIKLKDIKVIEPPKQEAPEEKKITAENVTTLAAAKQFLLENGATVEELQSKAAVFEWAAKHDIVFPNYK